MKAIIVGMAFIALLEMVVIAWLIDEERQKAREKNLRDGFPWDWTMERERKVQAVLELCCDKCHEPFRCSQDELDEECAMCPVPDAVYRLAGRRPEMTESPTAAPISDRRTLDGRPMVGPTVRNDRGRRARQ